MTMRIALYLRVSTNNKLASGDPMQHLENQREKLAAYAQAMGWEIVREYSDRESGSKATRPGFLALMDAASRHEFGLVLAWSLDRFSREGIGKTCEHLRRLAGYKIAFRSLNEPFLDTGGEFGELVTAIFAFFASFERKRIIERTVAGMDRARRQGKHVGRPGALIDRTRLSRLRYDEGLSLRQIAAKTGIPLTTVQRALKGAA